MSNAGKYERAVGICSKFLQIKRLGGRYIFESYFCLAKPVDCFFIIWVCIQQLLEYILCTLVSFIINELLSLVDALRLGERSYEEESDQRDTRLNCLHFLLFGV